MHSIDFCTPNNPTRALRASSVPGAGLLQVLTFRSLRSVPVRAASTARRPTIGRRSSSDDRSRSVHRKARNPSMRSRPGGFAFHDAITRFGDPLRLARRRFLPPSVSNDPPLTPLSPPPRCGSVDRACDAHVTPRRPPRSVPRSPRERLTLPRSEVPSLDNHRMHTARTEARTGHAAFARRTALT